MNFDDILKNLYTKDKKIINNYLCKKFLYIKFIKRNKEKEKK